MRICSRLALQRSVLPASRPRHSKPARGSNVWRSSWAECPSKSWTTLSDFRSRNFLRKCRLSGAQATWRACCSTLWSQRRRLCRKSFSASSATTPTRYLTSTTDPAGSQGALGVKRDMPALPPGYVGQKRATPPCAASSPRSSDRG
jgi:hypothetical protein